MSRQQAIEFLASGTRTGKLATASPSGAPHVAPVWFVLDGDELVFVTGYQSLKGRRLRANPRAALTVDHEEFPYDFVTVRGRVHLERSPADLLAWNTRIAGRYVPAGRADEYGQRNTGPDELLCRLRMDRVVAIAEIARQPEIPTARWTTSAYHEGTGVMPRKQIRGPRLPPRWFVHLAWSVHRGLYRVTRGRLGLWRPGVKRWGALRLTTIGRRTGRERNVIIAYLEDGPNLVAMAMNGWAAGEPAWWLNLQAHPDARVELAGGPRRVRARAAKEEERARLWARWLEVGTDLDAYAALRPTETAVVVFEPQPEPAGDAPSA